MKNLNSPILQKAITAKCEIIISSQYILYILKTNRANLKHYVYNILNLLSIYIVYQFMIYCWKMNLPFRILTDGIKFLPEIQMTTNLDIVQLNSKLNEYCTFQCSTSDSIWNIWEYIGSQIENKQWKLPKYRFYFIDIYG